jgi:3'(2'), 5'-bisphosphate nucleotidase
MIDLHSNINALQHLNYLEKIAREAGDAIMHVYKKALQVQYKSDFSPLTEADLNANNIIIEALKKNYPEIQVLTEESVADFKRPNIDGYYWLVDPLDGTKEFIKRNGEFTVNIALIHQGEPILGVVFAPEKNLMYRGARGHGAFKSEGVSTLKPIYVSSHEEGTTWKVMGSRSHSSEGIDSWLAQLGDFEFISMGSSLKICLIAEGQAHFYPRLGPTHLWDTAAAHVILKEAGGDIKDLRGCILNYADPSQTLNPFFIASSDKDFVRN